MGPYGTLIGAGGGFVLMPLLLLLYPHEPPENLTAISLAVVFCNALSGSIAYARMRRIDYRSGLMFAAAATPGSVIGALNTSYLSRWQFNLVFSIVLIGVALAMVWRPALRRNPRIKGQLSKFEVRRHLVEADGTCLDWRFRPIVGIVISFFVGYFSSFLGIGGGIIHVPALVLAAELSGARRHGHVAFYPGHHGVDRHPGASGGGYPVPGFITRRAAWPRECCWGRSWGPTYPAGSSRPWIIRSLALALAAVGVRILMSTWQVQHLVSVFLPRGLRL